VACLSGLPWFVRESAPLEHLSDLKIVAELLGDMNNALLEMESILAFIGTWKAEKTCFAGMNQLKKITGKEVWLRVAGGVVEAY